MTTRPGTPARSRLRRAWQDFIRSFKSEPANGWDIYVLPQKMYLGSPELTETGKAEMNTVAKRLQTILATATAAGQMPVMTTTEGSEETIRSIGILAEQLGIQPDDTQTIHPDDVLSGEYLSRYLARLASYKGQPVVLVLPNLTIRKFIAACNELVSEHQQNTATMAPDTILHFHLRRDSHWLSLVEVMPA